MPFNLNAPFKPTGDQPNAIKQLVRGIEDGVQAQTLLGVTGGKDFYHGKCHPTNSETYTHYESQ